MASAESQVQQMRYTATFPLLLNIADQPTYFMALKGADGLVKMYAMVNVQQYQIVETGNTVAECEVNYRQELANNNLIKEEQTEVTEPSTDSVTGMIVDIRTAVIDGNSKYFLQLNADERYYIVSAADDADVWARVKRNAFSLNVVMSTPNQFCVQLNVEPAYAFLDAYSVLSSPA
jgi:hypothetical protein